MTQLPRIAWILSLFVVLLSTVGAAETQLPEIPGITVTDPFPGGCVDCHIDRPADGMDVRLSTEMERWQERVDAKVLARVRAILGDTPQLSGQHPRLSSQSYEDIPASCMSCHASAEQNMLPLGPMLHALHLNGGHENHFLTLFGGECTHCHKFNADTGTWFIPSGPEK